MRKIRLDDSCLNHLTNIPVGFTRKSSYIHTFWEIAYRKYYVLCWQGVRTHLTQLVSLRHCVEIQCNKQTDRDLRAHLTPSKNRGEKIGYIVFITLFTHSSLTGSLFSSINLKYSCTPVTPSVLTGDCISQKVKVKRRIAVCKRSLRSPLRELTYHMGSHSVTCHPVGMRLSFNFVNV